MLLSRKFRYFLIIVCVCASEREMLIALFFLLHNAVDMENLKMKTQTLTGASHHARSLLTTFPIHSIHVDYNNFCPMSRT